MKDSTAWTGKVLQKAEYQRIHFRVYFGPSCLSRPSEDKGDGEHLVARHQRRNHTRDPLSERLSHSPADPVSFGRLAYLLPDKKPGLQGSMSACLGRINESIKESKAAACERRDAGIVSIEQRTDQAPPLKAIRFRKRERLPTPRIGLICRFGCH